MVGLIAVLAAVAQAQGVDAHGFHLAAYDGDVLDPLTLQRPERFVPWGAYAGGVFEYAEAPLVQYTIHLDGSETAEPVLDNLATFNLSAGVAVHSRARIDVSAPVFLTATGPGGVPQGAGIGDLRVGTLLVLVQPEAYADDGAAEGFALGVKPWIDIPSGASEAMLGQPGVSGGGAVTAAMGLSRAAIVGEIGVQANPALALDNLTGGDQLLAGLGVGLRVAPRWAVDAETRIEAPLQQVLPPGTGTPAEGILSLRHRQRSGAHLMIGGSTALTRGVGAAAYRLFVGGGFGRSSAYGPGTTPLDLLVTRDGRPVAGARVEVTSGGVTHEQVSGDGPATFELTGDTPWRGVATLGPCLRGQTEGETVPDEAVIALEPVREVPVRFEVRDSAGAPVAAATASWTPEATGCVPDGALALGPEGTGQQQIGPGAHQARVAAEGYVAQTVSVTAEPGTEAVVSVVLERVAPEAPPDKALRDLNPVLVTRILFPVDVSEIPTSMHAQLDLVAEILLERPDVRRLEVRGHTDITGTEGWNLTLSQQRAEAVRRYLVAKGVPAERLVARGYGFTMPEAPNATPTGRAKNRRVEFIVLEQDPTE